MCNSLICFGSPLVQVMDDKCDSNDLAIALRGNTKIIVTTIHKFYYILDNKLLTNLKDGRRVP